ncbi:MAG: alanine racemase [candidate division Zixibacteria bacterium]|nr:alanine racemase [candidate division Zixibacteria bacterium]
MRIRFDNRFSRPAFLEVDLDALAYNIKSIRKKIGKDVEFMAVVKADGYGHGAYQVAKTVLEGGADCLGVAILEEGIELREKGIKGSIVNLYPEPIGREKYVIEYDIAQVITDYAFALNLSREAQKNGKIAQIYVEVDTGLGRYGLTPEDTIKIVKKIYNLKNIRFKGIISQFSTADEKDKNFALKQLSIFKKTVHDLESSGYKIPIKSIANSGAVLDIPQSYFNQVRVGHLIYGLYPSIHTSQSIKVKPVLKWKSKIMFIKEVEKGTPLGYGRSYHTKKKSKIATIPLGYADGYSRLFSNKAEVLIHNKRLPVVGRVCMDAFMVDVSSIPDVKIGDEVVLIGKQGKETLSAHQLGKWTGTFSYEVLTRIGKRVPIVYLKES